MRKEYERDMFVVLSTISGKHTAKLLNMVSRTAIFLQGINGFYRESVCTLYICFVAYRLRVTEVSSRVWSMGGFILRKIGGMTVTFPPQVSDIFNPQHWRIVEGFEDFTDITYHRQVQRDETGEILRDLPTVRIAFNRPEVRNAFRPHTVDELYRALDHARMTSDVGTVLLTGNGPSPKDGGWAFCSGGDQRIRGRDGYHYASGDTAESIDPARAGRLHILEVQRLIRTMPKVVIALVSGWAAGGGIPCTWSRT